MKKGNVKMLIRNLREMEENKQCTIHNVVEIALTKVKRVNHGNVFGTKSWFTFYCGGCGSQVINRASKCEGTNPFVKGCGKELDWD